MRLKHLAAGLLAVCTAPAWADAQQNIRQMLDTLSFPVAVSSVSPSPVDGLYLIQLEGGQVLYASADGQHLIQGQMLSVKDGELRNLTAEIQAKAISDVVNGIPADHLVVFAPQQSKTHITVFTDVDCGFCRKLHEEVGQLNDLGIEVRYAAFPRGGMQSPTATTMRSIWCAEDQQAAMTRAKQEGRNNYQFYATDMDSANLDDLLLEHQLRSAISREELVLHYQPKVDAAGRLQGCEALIRWQHPDLGLLGPDRFIPVAEASGLILPIGDWVIEQACRQLRLWLDQGLSPVPVAINLSAQQLTEATVEQVRHWLQKMHLSPELLTLELTETMLMRDIQRTLVILNELDSMGVSLAIDDFGTGYSSLTYLHQLQVDTLKIDRSFVQGIGSTDDGTIAVTVIALAHSLGLKVVAEGVETEAQREFLTHHGCDYLQGFLFGRAETLEVFSARLPAHS